MTQHTIGTNEILEAVQIEANEIKKAFIHTPKPDENNWLDILNSHKINHNAKYSQPPIVLQIMDNAGNCNEFGSLGNFTLSIGKAKSRKTFWTNFITAAALKCDTGADKLKASFPNDKNIVATFDTEQSTYHVSKVSKRVLLLADGNNANNYEVFCLRPFSPSERLLLIEKYIYSTDNLGLLIIDGIRDLISDINNADEATMITCKLLKWTQERHIHIHVVIHQNKNDGNARGHLGAELVNKAESVISIEKDKDVSIVKPEFMRDRDFEPFAFSITPDGTPYILEDWLPGNNTTTTKQKLTAYDVAKEIHRAALNTVFKDGGQVKYKDFETDLKVVFQSFDVKLTDAQAKEFIRYYKQNNFVGDTGGKGRTGNNYYLIK